MNDRTDRPTPIERQGAPDCLVEIGLDWLARPVAGSTDAHYAEAVAEICLIVSQMRHRGETVMESERRRWIDRVTVRLCQQRAGLAGYEGAVRLELERRVTSAMLTYRDWRERVAPRLKAVEHAGPSENGEVAA